MTLQARGKHLGSMRTASYLYTHTGMRRRRRGGWLSAEYRVQTSSAIQGNLHTHLKTIASRLQVRLRNCIVKTGVKLGPVAIYISEEIMIAQNIGNHLHRSSHDESTPNTVAFIQRTSPLPHSKSRTQRHDDDSWSDLDPEGDGILVFDSWNICSTTILATEGRCPG